MRVLGYSPVGRNSGAMMGVGMTKTQGGGGGKECGGSLREFSGTDMRCRRRDVRRVGGGVPVWPGGRMPPLAPHASSKGVDVEGVGGGMYQ